MNPRVRQSVSHYEGKKTSLKLATEDGGCMCVCVGGGGGGVAYFCAVCVCKRSEL